MRVQESSARKIINTKESFIKFEKYLKVDKNLFYQFILDLDPQISTYESHAIFETADLSKDGYVNLKEFE